MAVYTSLTVKELAPLLAKYSIGQPLDLTPLEGGTTNSNYRLKTSEGDYVFTVLEPDEEAAQMVWLPDYLTFLSENNIPVPRVIESTDGQTVVEIKGKSAIITPFLTGERTGAH